MSVSHLLKVGTVLEKLGVRVGVGGVLITREEVYSLPGRRCTHYQGGGVLITREEVEGGGRVSERRWFVDERRVLQVVVLVLGVCSGVSLSSASRRPGYALYSQPQ